MSMSSQKHKDREKKVISQKFSGSERLKILLRSFDQNWQHARHVAAERYWLLSFYAIVVAAIFYALPAIMEDKQIAGLILLFLFLLTLSINLAFLKLNIAFGNCIRAVQWISEELELIKLREGKIYDAWTALPLPLPIRVHKWPYTHFPRFMSAGTAAALVAFLVHSTLQLDIIIVGVGTFIITSTLLLLVERIMNDKAEEIINLRKPKSHFINAEHSNKD